VTYPIVTALLGAPRVKTCAGSPISAVVRLRHLRRRHRYLWARSRTLEYLSPVLARLPQGATSELGPDATGSGGSFSTF
jgi:Cu(I)/Ag(I) efflux system membrane protein CusA/SilA